MTKEELKLSARQLLEDNILSFWMNEMQDPEQGGFYGQMDGLGHIHAQADKGAILNARILWTFSAAYRVLGEEKYLTVATRARDYFLSHFIDREYGGVYWSLDFKGNPKDTRKQFYALGFAIYGLSEYARATGDRTSLEEALALFDCIERHAFDPVYNGYVEATTRDWQPIADMRLSDKDQNYPKSQNTHLHIIEPYTNLLRCSVCRDVATSVAPSVAPSVATLTSRIKNLITLFITRIMNPRTHHLDLFFDNDWTCRSEGQVSCGHDIEFSWLLNEAALALDDPLVLDRIEPVVLQLSEIVDKVDTVWWEQAEAVVGFLNIYQQFGDEEAYKKAVAHYQYILDHLVDWDNGEWYWSILPDGSPNLSDDKAGFWKCPYHNGRMCLEIIERDF